MVCKLGGSHWKPAFILRVWFILGRGYLVDELPIKTLGNEFLMSFLDRDCIAHITIHCQRLIDSTRRELCKFVSDSPRFCPMYFFPSLVLHSFVIIKCSHGCDCMLSPVSHQTWGWSWGPLTHPRLWKGYIPYDTNCMTFWKRHTVQIRGGSVGVGWVDGVQRILRAVELLLCNTVVVGMSSICPNPQNVLHQEWTFM